ncbi:hypothetical protein [Leptospira meyeri]|uniref:hypothetical protein n=1 Tax=Leptospira meyeri TaxID=29508 RepID=UPI001083663A|nr:hypothetical protein [Leptospira meyeri]TGM61977.1 hypothetical protein EHQ93_11660 [Leptospira meyeri]
MLELRNKYTDRDICDRLLDNCNLTISYDPHTYFVVFNFLVYGMVDNSYFLVKLTCDGIWQINFATNSIEDPPDRSQFKPYITLGCSIQNGKLVDTVWMKNFDSISSCDKEIEAFQIDIFGDSLIKVICNSYQFSVFQLSEYEYLTYLKS